MRKIDEFYKLNNEVSQMYSDRINDGYWFSHDKYFKNLYEYFFEFCVAIRNLKEYLEKNPI